MVWIGFQRLPNRPRCGPLWPSGMPSAKILPRLMSLAAATTSAGVTWLSVPIWSSLPQRPQLESALKASSTACLETLMFRLLGVIGLASLPPSSL